MLVFNQAELFQQRHSDDPANQFLDQTRKTGVSLGNGRVSLVVS